MCDVIHRMMRKKPSDRFQTPAELEAALETLNSVGVNTRLSHQTGIGRFLASRLPDFRQAALAALVLLVLTFVAGRRMERPITLPRPVSAEAVPNAGSAIRQYAAAMLQPDRRAAWEAVMINYPDSPEAELAELRLGLALMSGIVPDVNEAHKVFTSVRNKGEVIPEKSYLKLLGMIGQAFTMKESERTEDYESLITEIKDLVLHYEGNLEMDLDRAPVELRDFGSRLQTAAQQALAPGLRTPGP
jgi:hypothetical protein